MRRLTAATPILAATALLDAPASAHHSQAMFDTTQEILFEGTVARFDWVNPHMYLIVETKGPDGKPALVEGEGLAITQALRRWSQAGRAQARHAGRHARESQSRRLGQAGPHSRRHDPGRRDSSLLCGEHAATRTLTPADSLAGHWAPSRQALGAAFGAMARWPVTPAGRAAQTKLVADGLCYCRAHSVPRGARRAAHDRDRQGRGRDALRQLGRPCRAHDPHERRASGQRATVASGALDRPVGGRHARDRYDRLRARPVRPRHERAVEHAQAHGRTADAHGAHPAALRDHRGRPGVSHQAGHAGAAVGPSPRPRLLAGAEACDPKVAARYRDHVPK